MFFVKIPLDRVGVLLGPKGWDKRRVEKSSGCSICKRMSSIWSITYLGGIRY